MRPGRRPAPCWSRTTSCLRRVKQPRRCGSNQQEAVGERRCVVRSFFEQAVAAAILEELLANTDLDDSRGRRVALLHDAYVGAWANQFGAQPGPVKP